MVQSVVVTGDHFQVFVGDSRHGPIVDTTHLWDAAVGVAYLPDAPQLIAIPTARYGGIVNVDLEILPAPHKASDCPGWKGIGEFKLVVESGELLLWGPETENLDAAPRVTCHPGTYAGTAYSLGTDEVTDELELEGPDRYRLCMWKLS